MIKIMNRIGFILLVFISSLTINSSCQNFFWSHTGQIDTIPAVYTCFGYLYNYYSVTDARELTSSGTWSVPTTVQWGALSTYLGGNSVSGGKLKETGVVYWDSPNTGATNEVGFNGRGGGQRLGASGDFTSFKTIGRFYSTTENRPFQIEYNSTLGYVNNLASSGKDGFSVRLVSDATGVPDGTTTTYTGNDGKVYNAVAINELYWTTENLEETEYRNGDPIPNVTDNTTWSNLNTGAWCVYDNDSNNKCK